VIDAFAALEIGVDRDTAVAHYRFGNRRADGSGAAGDEDDFVAQAAHALLPVIRSAHVPARCTPVRR
jgi:hypothetical protein